MSQLLFTTSMFMLQYCVPLGFILICYLKVVICLHRRNGKVDRERENETQLSENKIINMTLTSIMVSLGACWLSLNIFNIIFDWNHEVLLSCNYNVVFVACHLVDSFYMYTPSLLWISQQKFPEGPAGTY